jgi:hypothetical protein
MSDEKLIPIIGDGKDERFKGVHLLSTSDCGTEKTTAEVDKKFGFMVRHWELYKGHWFCRFEYSMPKDHVIKTAIENLEDLAEEVMEDGCYLSDEFMAGRILSVAEDLKKVKGGDNE